MHPKPTVPTFKPLQYEDMYGNVLGDDLAWHAYTRGVLTNGGRSELGQYMDNHGK